KLTAMAQQQSHEQQLAQIQRDSGKKKLKIAVGVASVVLVFSVVFAVIAFKSSEEERVKREAALAAERGLAQGR
ncbi:MAG: hypothetical protein ACPGNP_11420, partial [Acidimicrobiales bacterium]